MRNLILALSLTPLFILGACGDTVEQHSDSNIEDKHKKPAPRKQRVPVLLIPGIAGSVLERDIPQTEELDVAWVAGVSVKFKSKSEITGKETFCIGIPLLDKSACLTISGGNENFKRFMMGKYDAKTGTMLPVFSDPSEGVVKPHTEDNCHPDQEDKLAENQLCGIEYLFTPSTRGLDKFITQTIFQQVRKQFGAFSAYFNPMVSTATKKYGYNIGETLFGFPYDWRLSNVHNADLLKARIEVLFTATKQPLDLIAHSMGNMLVMAYMAKYPEDAKQKVRTWVAMAPPFQGAPNVATRLMDGYNFGNLTVCSCTTRPTFAQSPSTFELIPSKNFAFEKHSVPFGKGPEARFPIRPFVSYLKGTQASSTLVTLSDNEALLDFMRAGYKDYEFCEKPGGATVNASISEDAKQAADEYRTLVDSLASQKDLPPVYIAYGTGVKTPYGISYKTPVQTARDLINQCGTDNCSEATKCAFPSCNSAQSGCQGTIIYSDGDGTLDSASAVNPPFLGADFVKVIEEFKKTEHTEIIQKASAIKKVFSEWLKP